MFAKLMFQQPGKMSQVPVQFFHHGPISPLLWAIDGGGSVGSGQGVVHITSHPKNRPGNAGIQPFQMDRGHFSQGSSPPGR